MEGLSPSHAAELFRLTPEETEALLEAKRLILPQTEGLLDELLAALRPLPGLAEPLSRPQTIDRLKSGLRRWLGGVLQCWNPRSSERTVRHLGQLQKHLGLPSCHLTVGFCTLQELCAARIDAGVRDRHLAPEPAARARSAIRKRLATEYAGIQSVYAQLVHEELEARQSDLEATVRVRSERLRSTVSLSQAIADEIDEPQLMRALAEHVMTTFAPDFLAIHVIQDGDLVDTPVTIEHGKVAAARQTEQALTVRRDWQLCRAARTGRAFAVPDVSAALVQCPFQRPEQRKGTFCCIPLTGGLRVHGWMHVTCDRPGAFDEDDLEVLGIYGKMVGAAITSMRLLQENRQQATTDPLTGLSNRRHFEGLLCREDALLRRRGGAASVLMLDVDKFKSFNDEYGHEAGDRVLTRLAEALRTSVRETDLVARLGGDEFVVLLHGCESAAAMKVAEAIIQDVARTPLHVGAEQGAPIRVSIGVASCPQHARLLNDALRCADAALLEAKAAGAGRAMLHKEPAPRNSGDATAAA